MLHNNVFISYAKEDINYAEKLYDFLSSKNYDPWLDKKKLLPGHDWSFFIQDALRKADFIVLLLSNISVNKRGYVQREYKKALEYCEYKLDSDIYVIPLKIDDCEVPMNLQKFQWIDYDMNAFNQIERSIETQRKSIINTTNTLDIGESIIEVSENIIEGELGENSPKYIYEFHYPQFDLNESESVSELNILIKSEVLSRLISVRDYFYKYLIVNGKDNALDPENPEDSTTYGKVEINFINSHLVSFTSFISEYETGTAHGMFGTKGVNYFNNPIRPFELIELFEDKTNFVKTIRNCVHQKLMEIADNADFYGTDEKTGESIEMNSADKRNSFYVYDHGLEVKEENFDNYYFKKDSVVFIFNPYEITAWSEGAHFPEITFGELRSAFPEEIKLHDFISKF